MTDGNLAHALAEGLEALDLDLPPRASEQLLAFLSLLAEWNRAYNLTAVRDPLEMVRRHLLDSLTVLPHLRGGQIVDLGSGAGLPGIPLAIADPDRQFILLESNGKKVRFMRHAISQLGLSRVTVVQGRAESVQLSPPPDTVVARAVADLATLCGYARQLGAPGVWLVAMKGPDVAAELAGVPADFAVQGVLPVVVPGLEAARHLVCLRLMNGESD
ncbi:MAG TPA: 16S rRNA (guanine(527)-N(7))-methyltransferase RsmG [Candidatus Macondimonas sp.]|nr:16S rRNA (guanine(527)-N(7))-methyltransferase RsmG [Candidatus Macondimonas sp.]